MKINFSKTMKYELREINSGYVFIGMIFNFVCTAISLLYGGKVNLITVLWLIMTTLMGVGIGIVYNNTEKFREVYKYKGIFLYIMMMIFNIIWMPIFYRANRPILALVDIVIIGIFTFFVIYYYSKVNYTAAFVMLLYLMWVLIIIFLNIIHIH